MLLDNADFALSASPKHLFMKSKTASLVKDA